MSARISISDRYRQAAWILWVVVAVVISTIVIRSVIVGAERSVTPAYQSAVDHWFAGEPLYNMSGHGFLYPPQAVLAFAPWGLLPHGLCEVTWRLSMLVVLALCVVRLNQMLKGDGRSFFVISISMIFLALGCARNGQATLMITGLLVLAIVDLSERRWWRAAILFSLGFAFKPLILVPILLAGVIYPQMSWRLLASMLFVGVLPFMTQRPDYVISQYHHCIQSMGVTFEVGETGRWAQFFGMLQIAGIQVPSAARSVIRVLAAFGTLVCCFRASQILSAQKTAFYILAFSACYLMLFNSRTEVNTYAMVGPVYGAMLAVALRNQNRSAIQFLTFAVILTVLNYDLAALVSRREDAIWLGPLVCVAVSYKLVLDLIREVAGARLGRKLNSDVESGTTEQRIAA